MFGWIEGIFSRAANTVDSAVRALVHAAIRGIYGFLHSIFGAVIRGWSRFYGDVTGYARHELEWAREVYNALVRLFRHLIPFLNNRITVVNITINNRITNVTRVLQHNITVETQQRKASILSLLAWIIAHILRPFLAFSAMVTHWLTHEGAMMLHYFTHLAEFAELLFWWIVHSLEKHAWDAAKVLGEFFLALLVHNLKRVALLLEDIIHAVL